MPDDPGFRPGAHDLETPFIFVPHGAPDPVEWKRQHPGWVNFPATFVPHPRPIPKWRIINGQRWPLDKRGRPWPRTRYGRPTCPFDELPPGFPAPGTQYELMRKLENPTLFWEGEPTPTVAEILAIGERSRAERAAAAPPPPSTPLRAYDGDGPVRDYMAAMKVVDQQLREFAAAARQREAARQDAAPSERIDHDLLVTPDMTPPSQAEPAGAGPAGALIASGTATVAGPAIPGALGQGTLGRAAAGLLGVVGAPAALLGGVFWPSPIGDSTLSGTGLTLADAPGLELPTLPDAANPGFGADPDAGKPTVLVTPSSPPKGPEIEVFDPPSFDAALFDNRTIEDFRIKLNKQVKHLKSSDLDAARQERANKVVAVRPDGVPFNHVQEVVDALGGMIGLTVDLKRRLSHPGLSEADREAATALLSEASRKIEEARRMVPGIDEELGADK